MYNRTAYLLIESFERMKRIANPITEKHDIETVKRRLDIEMKNAIVFFNEMCSIFHQKYLDDITEARGIFIESKDEIMALDNVMTIKQRVLNLVNSMPEERMKDLDEYDLSTYYSTKKDSYDFSAAIMEEDLYRIVDRIKTYRKINMLDSRMKNGINAQRFKQRFLGDVDIYGMEVSSFLANEAKDRNVYHKIAKGGLEYSKCSNQVFDVVLHAPVFETDVKRTQAMGLKASNEALDIRKVTPYLRYGGVLIYYMHKYRLNNSMINYISKNYEDICVMEETDQSSMIIIIARRKVFVDEIDNAVFTKLKGITIDKVPCDSIMDKEYTIDGEFLDVKIFRGSVLDESDVLEIIEDTKLLDNFLKEKNEELKSDYERQQPLLPFNLGQIGLVLTSGCLDGSIEEMPGQYHVIKGAVKKESIEEIIKGPTRKEDETIITHINKVQIKILTPDGEIKTLA